MLLIESHPVDLAPRRPQLPNCLQRGVQLPSLAAICRQRGDYRLGRLAYAMLSGQRPQRSAGSDLDQCERAVEQLADTFGESDRLPQLTCPVTRIACLCLG